MGIESRSRAAGYKTHFSGIKALIIIVLIVAFLIALLVIAVKVFLFLLPVILVVLLLYYLFKILNKGKKSKVRPKRYVDVEYEVKK